MTGFNSKRNMAQDKLEQWDMPSEAFNAWWDSDYDDSTNPYEKDTFAYWAWAGWQAALAQPAQEPDEWFGGWRVQDFHDACKKPAQEPVARVLQIIKELRPAIRPLEVMGKGKTTDEWFDTLVKEIEQAFKEKNT